jgi:hypothetical protein
MRLVYLGLCLCALAEEAGASERAAQLVNSFQIMCTLEPLDFARSESKAVAMRLPVRQDLRTPPNASGHLVRVKSWLLPLKSGPHEFSVTEGLGPKGEIKACGIAAPDVGKDDFQAELVKTMKLGKPAAESMSADGTLSTVTWPSVFNGLELMFSGRRDRSGIYLFLQTPLSK